MSEVDDIVMMAGYLTCKNTTSDFCRFLRLIVVIVTL